MLSNFTLYFFISASSLFLGFLAFELPLLGLLGKGECLSLLLGKITSHHIFHPSLYIIIDTKSRKFWNSCRASIISSSYKASSVQNNNNWRGLCCLGFIIEKCNLSLPTPTHEYYILTQDVHFGA